MPMVKKVSGDKFSMSCVPSRLYMLIIDNYEKKEPPTASRLLNADHLGEDTFEVPQDKERFFICEVEPITHTMEMFGSRKWIIVQEKKEAGPKFTLIHLLDLYKANNFFESFKGIDLSGEFTIYKVREIEKFKN